MSTRPKSPKSRKAEDKIERKKAAASEAVVMRPPEKVSAPAKAAAPVVAKAAPPVAKAAPVTSAVAKAAPPVAKAAPAAPAVAKPAPAARVVAKSAPAAPACLQSGSGSFCRQIRSGGAGPLEMLGARAEGRGGRHRMAVRSSGAGRACREPQAHGHRAGEFQFEPRPGQEPGCRQDPARDDALADELLA